MCIHTMMFKLLNGVVSRREFLKITGAAAVGLGVMAVPNKSWAKEKLTWGFLANSQIHEIGPMIIKEKGLLAKAGYDVKFNEYLAGGMAMQHFAAGEADFVTCGVAPMLIARGAGTDIVMLASSSTEGYRIIALSEIKKIEDLSGKKVGTPGLGSIPDALLTIVERKYKISVNKVTIKVTDMPIYLQKKEISGFISWEPHCSNALHLGYGHSLLTSADFFPGHQCCGLGVHGKLLREKPEMVEKVTKVYVEAIKYFHDHKEDMTKLVAEKMALPVKVLQESLKIMQHPYPPYIHMESLRVFTKELIDTGKIPAGKVTNVEKFLSEAYNDKFVRAAVKK